MQGLDHDCTSEFTLNDIWIEKKQLPSLDFKLTTFWLGSSCQCMYYNLSIYIWFGKGNVINMIGRFTLLDQLPLLNLKLILNTTDQFFSHELANVQSVWISIISPPAIKLTKINQILRFRVKRISFSWSVKTSADATLNCLSCHTHLVFCILYNTISSISGLSLFSYSPWEHRLLTLPAQRCLIALV